MSLVLPYMPASMVLPSLADDLVLPSLEFIAAAEEVLLIEQGIQQLLSNDSAIAALVGSRIYSPMLPQTVTYPAITYRKIGNDSIDQLNNRGSTGLAESRFAIFSISKGPSNYYQANRIAEAVRLALQGYRGTITDPDFAPIDVQLVKPIGTNYHYDDPTQTHRVESIFDVWATEQQPEPLAQ